MADQRQIAALLRERDGLKQRGLNDRVSQVDEQLQLLGYAPADEESAKREVRKQPPQGRSTKPQQTVGESAS